MIAFTPNFIDKKIKPLYEQLYDYIKEEINNGNLEPGKKLPSIRFLSKYLGVSKSTVENAYQQLVLEGYVKSRPKSGLYIEVQNNTVLNQKLQTLKKARSRHRHNVFFDFDYRYVHIPSFPIKLWKSYTSSAYANEVDENMNPYPDINGEMKLRNEISDYLYQIRGFSCSPEQIFITPGLRYSLDFLCQTILKDHTNIAMEEPGCDQSREIFKRNSLLTIPIPIERDGINIKELFKSRSRLVYTTPSHQFPLGIRMSLEKRQQLIDWAKENNGFIIEDDYDSELSYEGKPIPSIKALSQFDNTIYLGTFSKWLLPSLRVSVMVLPSHLIQKYNSSLRFLPSVPRIMQNTLYHFIKSGDWERHARRMRMIYEKKRGLLISSIKKHFSEESEIIGDRSGLHLVLKLNSSYSEKQLIEIALNNGVKVYSTEMFWMRSNIQHHPHIMIGFGAIPYCKIETGIKLLKEAWSNYLSKMS